MGIYIKKKQLTLKILNGIRRTQKQNYWPGRETVRERFEEGKVS